jgi:hypothetical protein
MSDKKIEKKTFTRKYDPANVAVKLSDADFKLLYVDLKEGKVPVPVFQLSGKSDKFVVDGGTTMYGYLKILNPTKYPKTIEYVKFKIDHNNENVGCCLLASNPKFKKSGSESKKAPTKTFGKMILIYKYPDNIEKYVSMEDKDIRTDLDKHLETTVPDVVERGKQVNKELTFIKRCIPAYIRDEVIIMGFEQSFKHKNNVWSNATAFCKIGDSEGEAVEFLRKFSCGSHKQAYRKLKIENPEDVILKKEFFDAKDDTKLIGPGKKFIVVKDDEYVRLSTPIYWSEMMVTYDTTQALDVDNYDGKIISGNKNTDGTTWGKFAIKVPEKKANGTFAMKTVEPTYLNEIKGLIAPGSLCKLETEYQATYSSKSKVFKITSKLKNINVLVKGIKQSKVEVKQSQGELDIMNEYNTENDEDTSSDSKDSKDNKTENNSEAELEAALSGSGASAPTTPASK